MPREVPPLKGGHEVRHKEASSERTANAEQNHAAEVVAVPVSVAAEVAEDVAAGLPVVALAVESVALVAADS